MKCEQCKDKGVLFWLAYNHECGGNIITIERCDACEKYPSDIEAAEAVAQDAATADVPGGG